MKTTKRGRGQRRSRRLKNRSIELARRMALQHLHYNPPQWGRSLEQELPSLTAYFRSMLAPRRDPDSWLTRNVIA